MAQATVSQFAPAVKESDTIHFDYINGQRPVVLSTDIARHFQIRHKNVLRDIDRLRSMLPESFHQLNFEPMQNEVKIGNGATRKDRAFQLTRDAFSMLVMGFTGKAAIMWKLRYIEAFNSLEAAVLENRSELAREAGYQQGLDYARSLPGVQAERKAGYLEGLKAGRLEATRNNGLAALQRMKELRQKGCTWCEIGKIMGIKPDTARKRVARLGALAGV